MKILENLKLDSWYGIVLYVGILIIAASLFFQVDFLQEKHLFGLGLGMLLIGLSFWIAEGYAHIFKPPNYYTGGPAILYWRVIKHNPISIIILLIGIGLTGFFGFLIVKGLI
jgi:hypothetical protein